MSVEAFSAKIDREVSYFAVGSSEDDIRNVYASLFVSRSYPFLTARCFFRDGWHPPDGEHYFLRQWNNGDVDWPSQVDRTTAERIVTMWGYSLDDGLSMLAAVAFRAVISHGPLFTPDAFLAEFGFAPELRRVLET